MRILLVGPGSVRSISGNRVTVERWARLLRQLGHRVRVARDYRGELCDLLIALHARKSFAAIRRFRMMRPGAPLVVALGGTDIYRDLCRSRTAQRALDWATHIIVLQPLALRSLAARWRRKARVILQSAPRSPHPERPPPGEFRVCVLSNLRAIKDPLRPALAARLLPAASRIRVVHLGRALESRLAARARREMARNPRYDWPGEVSRRRALSILAGSRLLVLPSRLEGGANVVSEALAAGVPVLASRIPGSAGILGRAYPGLFPVGHTRRLARLLRRSESDGLFYVRLKSWCRRLAPRVRASRERAALRDLLREIRPLR